jgi:hypothetical protein
MSEAPTENLHLCPGCKNQFVQPFVCTTCGAQKLYDETVRQQALEIERLREREKMLLESHTGCGCDTSCPVCEEKGFT